MKRLAVAVGLLALLSASVVSAQTAPKVQNVRSMVAYPAQAELDHYPVIWTHTPSHAEVVRTMSALGLHLDTLKVAWTGYNWYRGIGRFVYETIPAGTPVWADSTGTPRYRDDCGNRLVEESKCPKCDSIKSAVTTDSATLHPIPSPNSPGFWARLTLWMKGLALGLWNGIDNAFAPFGWLALLLAGIGFIALIVFLLWMLWRFLTRDRRLRAYTSATDTDDHREPPRRPPGSGATPGPDAQTERRRVTFYPASSTEKDNVLRFKGVHNVRYEHQDDTTTLRFRHTTES